MAQFLRNSMTLLWGAALSTALCATSIVAATAQETVTVDEQAGVVRLTKADCQRLTVHVPDAEVAYQPGVSVRGDKVAPADLNAQPIELPETIRIPITVDFFERYGLPNPANFEAEAEIGTVEVHKDGRAYFNGQPLQDEAQWELAQRCQKIMRDNP